MNFARLITTPFFAPGSYSTIVAQLVRREVQGRYRGSLLGIGWSLLSPLAMLAAYTFVFVGVFKARWPGATEGGGALFALQLFTGLAIFNLFSENLGKSPTLITDQPNLVKKVVFPLETLAWVSVATALFHFVFSFIIILAGSIFFFGTLHASLISVPMIMFPLVILMLGCSWLLSAIGVFIRDIAQVINLFINLLLFLSPVFYSTSSLPEKFRPIVYLNPLSWVIENIRAAIFEGRFPDVVGWLIYTAVASTFTVCAAAFFQMTRKSFSDVL